MNKWTSERYNYIEILRRWAGGQSICWRWLNFIICQFVNHFSIPLENAFDLKFIRLNWSCCHQFNGRFNETTQTTKKVHDMILNVNSLSGSLPDLELVSADFDRIARIPNLSGGVLEVCRSEEPRFRAGSRSAEFVGHLKFSCVTVSSWFSILDECSSIGTESISNFRFSPNFSTVVDNSELFLNSDMLLWIRCRDIGNFLGKFWKCANWWYGANMLEFRRFESCCRNLAKPIFCSDCSNAWRKNACSILKIRFDSFSKEFCN